MRRWLVACATLAWCGGCAEMPEIKAGTCGNAVVEPDKEEDCDTFAGEGDKCRPPGSEAACHWDCRAQADGSVPQCPGGWGCDAQGVCREASGDFAREGPLEAGDVHWLAVADFDGDARPDLVSADMPNNFAQARFSLHYFDADGELSQSRVFPKQVTHPLISRLGEDRSDDLLFADSDLRIGVLLGRHDRSWVPSTFSTYQLDGPGPFRIVSVYDGNVASGDGVGAALAIVASFFGENGLFLPSLEGGNRLKLLAPLSESLQDLAGEPVTGNLIEGLDSPCRELIVAFRGAGSVRFFDVCEAGEPWPHWRTQPVGASVALPDGVSIDIDAAPLAVDVNADGHLDLMIKADGRAYVAYGNGSALEPVMHPFAFARFMSDELERGMPLAVGDFTGDGAPDLVFPDRVTASQRSALTGEPQYLDVYVNQNEPWTIARIADLNADGYPDVVAASDSGPDIVYLNGTGELEPVPSVIEARSSVPLLAIDDLDGDGVDDLAFVEHDLERASLDAVKIGFGQLGGPPLPPVQVAQVEGAEQLSAFHQSGIGNLILASSEVIDGRRRGLLALLTGSPDRLPFAPFVLVDFAQDGDLREFAALQLALGAFGAPQARDVMALGTPYEPINEHEGVSFWLVRGIERGKGAPRLLEGGMPDGFEPLTGMAPRLKVQVASTSADLDGDGRDESVWLMPAEAGTRCGLFMAGVDGAGERLREPASLLLDTPCAAPAISAQDLDGDGSVDLLVGLADQDSGALLVLWNDRKGRFDLNQSSSIETEDHAVVRAWGSVGGEPARIALITDEALWLVDKGAEPRSFAAPTRTEDLTRGKALAVADLNGDGLQDLAVGDAEGLWLLKARFK